MVGVGGFDFVACLRQMDGHRPQDVLGLVVSEFRQRERCSPVWVEAGEGVVLPPGSARAFGLVRVTGRGCRPDCIMVGRDVAD
jgi:hypothetical protein